MNPNLIPVNQSYVVRDLISSAGTNSLEHLVLQDVLCTPLVARGMEPLTAASKARHSVPADVNQTKSSYYSRSLFQEVSYTFWEHLQRIVATED